MNSIAMTKALFFIGLIMLSASFAGFSQTKDTSGGKIVSQEKFQRLMKKRNTVVLDVRTADEFKAGHIPGAIQIDVMKPEQFKAQVSALDQSKRYLLYCKSGRRSKEATIILKSMGFQKIFDLTGGYSKWTGAKAN